MNRTPYGWKTDQGGRLVKHDAEQEVLAIVSELLGLGVSKSWIEKRLLELGLLRKAQP